MEKMLKQIEDLVFQSAIVGIDDIAFSTDVRDACKKNMCGLYNTRWTCPPAVGTLEEVEAKCKKYKYALVFTSFDMIEDSFDFEGMLDVRAKHDKIQQKVVERLNIKDSLLLGAGGCTKCKKCNYPNPCRFPKYAVPSVESYGINVVELAQTANINYCNGENTVTYFSIIFFNEP